MEIWKKIQVQETKKKNPSQYANWNLNSLPARDFLLS